MAAPTFVNATKTTGATQSTVTCTEPASVAADDILVASVYAEAAVTLTAPTGWSDSFNGTALQVNLSTPDTWSAHLFWTRRGGSAPTFAFPLGASAYSQGACVAYRGALASGDPWSFGVTAIRNDGVSRLFPAASGTTLDADEMLVWVGMNFVGGSGSTQPTGFTSRQAIASDDITTADKTQASAGGTGSVTGASWSGASLGNAAVILAGLRPTGGGGGGTTSRAYPRRPARLTYR